MMDDLDSPYINDFYIQNYKERADDLQSDLNILRENDLSKFIQF